MSTNHNLEKLEDYPSLSRLKNYDADLELTEGERETFLLALESSLQLKQSPGTDAILRCLDLGVASLHRRRELAREVTRLSKTP